MINIKHFAESISSAVGITKGQAEAVIKEMTEHVIKGVDDGETINISGIGNFKRGIRKGRTCVNPRTGEPMSWEDTAVVKYHPASRFTRTLRK